MIKEKGRATRSDKKHDIKPTIPIKLKETIYRLSYITDKPVKDVGVYFCEAGIISPKNIEYMSQFFKRDIWLRNTLYRGNLENISVQSLDPGGKKERITLRFSQQSYENIRRLAYTLDVTSSKATGFLLDVSIRDADLVNKFVRDYISKNVNQARMKELKEILIFINNNNPYEEEISWVTLLSFLYEEMKEGTINLNNSFSKWLNSFK
ncbi:hypothetical protein [Cytobacillus pseudoceanisediminis]|uniref:hypothetical protein n=1 Tax=Cytobacillus pseudoceanisediminis TaxID=3051614 RepID=UPI003C302B47